MLGAQAAAVMPERKERLIGAAVTLTLKQGFAATSVDEICAEAGVTKGSFFHYFPSKEHIFRAAMDAWGCGWQQIIEEAGFEEIENPVERLFHLFEVMEEAYMAPNVAIGCVVGMVAQELSHANERMREHADMHLDLWAEKTSKLLRDAKEAQKPAVDFDPDSLTTFLMAMVQGSMVVAKSRQDRDVLRNNVHHAKAYVGLLFGREKG